MMKGNNGAQVTVTGENGRVILDINDGGAVMDMSTHTAGHLISMLFDAVLSAGPSRKLDGTPSGVDVFDV